MERTIKNCFKNGAIASQFIGESIDKHQSKKTIGAHQIFLGQVRADMIEGKEVVAIDYTAFDNLANKVFDEIREEAFLKFDLVCMHIYHSLGLVESGQICLFVFVSSKHRKMAQQAVEYIVEEIKSRAPIFGKEIFMDQSAQWKVNN
ncbi:MAG: molybdenum cofactor biosynthesis protein MoaE [Flavobacteriia bacterium]